jgi:hypothetical protein
MKDNHVTLGKHVDDGYMSPWGQRWSVVWVGNGLRLGEITGLVIPPSTIIGTRRLLEVEAQSRLKICNGDFLK